MLNFCFILFKAGVAHFTHHLKQLENAYDLMRKRVILQWV